MKEYINNSKIIPEIISSPKNKYFKDNSTETRKINKKGSISKISSSGIFDETPEKYTLTKLINSVSNYRKETGSDFKIDVSSIKPNRLFHVDSYKAMGMDVIPPHRASFIQTANYKNIPPLKAINNSVINNNTINEKKIEKNTKKNIIDYFPIDKLIKIETKFIILISKLKNIEQLKEEYIIWINEFKNSPFYEFNFIFKNAFDNESPIKENVSTLIKNSTNLIVITNIICFWIIDKNANKNNNDNNKTLENIDMKYIYELMINNHKLYLLLCLFILIESNLINNNENIYVLRLIEQIKAYLSKILRNIKNRMLVINEIKSVSKSLVNIINKINEQNIIYSQELVDNTNNLEKVDISVLFDIFEKIKNKNYLNNKNNYYTNDINNIIIQDDKYKENENENINNLSKKKYFKKIGKLNEYKTNQFKNRLYIKKTIPNRQINNKKVTNKIINIIINNNSPNITFDSQNQFNLNNNNINKNNNLIINSINQNNYAQELTNYNNQDNNYITIDLNNNDRYNINNYNNILPQYNNITYSNYSNTIIRPEKNNINYKINNMKYNTNNNPNININTTNYLNDTYLLNKQQKFLQPDPPYLPPKQNKSDISPKKYTLILDLDETLVRYKTNEENTDEAKIIFRPGLFYFLNKVYPLFDIVIWTVATKEYADPIIDIIEENKKYFLARLFREHATIYNNNYVKDLTNLGRDINTIIIIDDKESSFSFQKQNGILIKPFFGTYLELKNDCILYDLFKILTKILLDKSEDVRFGINKYQYEIKQKISKISNKNNFDNIEGNKDYYTNNINSINNKVNKINNNINKGNKKYISLKNSIIKTEQTFNNTQPINRSFSMSNSTFNKFSK